jgi:hypothetical protein
MGTIDLGRYSDSWGMSLVEVPDRGPLPDLVDSVAGQVSGASVLPGEEYGLGKHRWVEVVLSRRPCYRSSLLIMYAANRSEWVCLACDSYFSPYGHLYGDHWLKVPYRVTPALLNFVLRAYGVPAGAIPPGETERIHPDQLKPNASSGGWARERP